MEIEPPFKTDPQLTKARQPSVGPPYHPEVTTQPLIALKAQSGYTSFDTSPSQVGTTAGIVIPFVGMQLIWSASWQSFLTRETWDRVKQCLKHDGIMTIGSCYQHLEGDTLALYHNVAFAA